MSGWSARAGGSAPTPPTCSPACAGPDRIEGVGEGLRAALEEIARVSPDPTAAWVNDLPQVKILRILGQAHRPWPGPGRAPAGRRLPQRRQHRRQNLNKQAAGRGCDQIVTFGTQSRSEAGRVSLVTDAAPRWP